MTIRVKLFAILRDRAGLSDFKLDLRPGATIDDASQAIAQRHPIIAEFLNRVAFAVNQDYVDRKNVLRENDELAIIPPVSGG
jgi:molybdopterin converting factor subunit 1